MKRLLIAICFLVATQPFAQAQDVEITYQQFYNELEPYGAWISYPQYGYVWQPYFERPGNFTPYSSGGHWVYTDYGWTWVSDYEWGWATFHYGRWVYDDYLGWLWIPGYEWAPAWVTWGSYGGNYGWAPLGPGVTISAGMSWRPPRSNWWTFVPCSRFGGSDWNRYIVRNNTTVINQVTIINNVYADRGRGGGRPASWMRGPRREDVERLSRRQVQPMTINTVRRPEPTRVQNNNSIAVYRPVVNRGPQGTPFRPGKAQPLAAVRPGTRMPINNNDRRDNNPGNNRPINRPANPQPPSRPGNPEIPTNRSDRPDRPYPPRPASPNPAAPEQRPGAPRQETRPVNPGTRPENRPGNPPPNQEAKPPLPPGSRPDPRPGKPIPERPINRPPNARPPSRPGNPEMPNNRSDRPSRPAMPPSANRPPATPPPNRPATPPTHREQPRKEAPPPGRKDN